MKRSVSIRTREWAAPSETVLSGGLQHLGYRAAHPFPAHRLGFELLFPVLGQSVELCPPIVL